MQPLQEVAIGIRARFYENYRKTIQKRSDYDEEAILSGNFMAHNGDLRTDVALLKHGYLTDNEMFYELYGILIENAEKYTSRYTILILILLIY